MADENGMDVSAVGAELSYEDKLRFVSVIAKPMAGKKLTKKLYKLVKKAAKESKTNNFRTGLKDVQKALRKDEKGLAILAGDVTPVEIMCHIPAVCETKEVPYCYVPSRMDLGSAMGVRRSTLIVLVKPHESYNELYQECLSSIRELPFPLAE